MKNIVLLAVIVALISGCSSEKKRLTQEEQFTVNAVVKPENNGTSTVSVSAKGPNYNIPYNVNVSVATGSIKNTPKVTPLITTTPVTTTPKNVWYSSSNPNSNKVVMPEKEIKINKDSKIKVDPNTNKVIWVD